MSRKTNKPEKRFVFNKHRWQHDNFSNNCIAKTQRSGTVLAKLNTYSIFQLILL